MDEITRADIDGIRDETRALTDSVNNLADRQGATDAEVAQKADQATVDAIAELQRGRKWNRRIAVAALVLVLIGLGLMAKWNSDRIDDADTTRQNSRAADCRALDLIADANIKGANAIVVNPLTRQAYAMGTHEAFAAVKAQKGYSADCSVIGPPPDPNSGG